MPRLITVLLALVLLTGMSREQVLQQVDGTWRATVDEDNWTTASAFVFNADLGTFNGDVTDRHYEGEVRTVVVIGTQAVLTFDGHFSVAFRVDKDMETLALSINGKPPLVYRKLKEAGAP